MSRCPEAEYRETLSDAEFWDWVLNRQPDALPDIDIDDEEMAQISAQRGECPVCGGYGACAYDEHGNALVHVVPEDHE